MKKLLVSVIALFGAVSLSAQDVTAIYNEAAAAFGAKNFTEAATKFEQVIDQGMDNESAASMVATAKSTLPKCYFMLGGGALKTKNYDEALKNFEKSAELAELYGDMNQMAKSNGWVAKMQAANDFDGIIKMADDLLAKNPQSALAQNVRLQAYANKKDYAKVIELGQAAADAQTDPADKSLMYYLLGAAYNAKEMKPQAIAAFKQVTDGPAAENAKAALAELSK